jgi:hypothetical protein
MYPITTGNVKENLGGVLRTYQSHGLDSLKEASLMRRVDTKFLLPVARVPELLNELTEDYTALEIDGKRCFSYLNDYYDSNDFGFYRMHHNRFLNRYKVRVRKYCDSGQSYLEVKFKNNKKSTLKTRISLHGDELDLESLGGKSAFLQASGISNAAELLPTLRNRYKRIALASEARAERVAIDLGLQSDGLHAMGTKINLENIAILELKQKRIDRRSPLFSLIKQMGIRPSRFSKYCMGLAFSTPSRAGLKYNRFKRLMMRVEKIEANPCLSFAG